MIRLILVVMIRLSLVVMIRLSLVVMTSKFILSFMSYRVININYSVICYTNHINSTRIQSIASMALMVFPDDCHTVFVYHSAEAAFAVTYPFQLQSVGP